MKTRPADEDEASAVRAIYAPTVETTAVPFEYDPPGTAAMADRIIDTLGEHPWLVGEIETDVAGYAYAGRHRERDTYRWSVTVSADVVAVRDTRTYRISPTDRRPR